MIGGFQLSTTGPDPNRSTEPRLKTLTTASCPIGSPRPASPSTVVGKGTTAQYRNRRHWRTLYIGSTETMTEMGEVAALNRPGFSGVSCVRYDKESGFRWG